MFVTLIVAACAIAALRYRAKRSVSGRAAANSRPFFHSSEIWWVRLLIPSGSGAGHVERQFTRPMVVLKNYNPSLFLGAPLAPSAKSSSHCEPIGAVGRRIAHADLSRLRNIDSARLLKKIAQSNLENFDALRDEAERVCYRITRRVPPAPRQAANLWSIFHSR
jgi:hypothetical protein